MGKKLLLLIIFLTVLIGVVAPHLIPVYFSPIDAAPGIMVSIPLIEHHYYRKIFYVVIAAIFAIEISILLSLLLKENKGLKREEVAGMKKVIFFALVGLLAVVMSCTYSQYTTKKLSDVDLVAERPIWQVGDIWTYRIWRTGYSIYFYTLEVVDDSAILPASKGKECYKLVYRWYNSLPPAKERGYHWEFYSKQSLEYLGKMGKDEKFVAPQISQYVLIFPLKLNSKWSQPYFQVGISEERAEKISITYTVTGPEEFIGPPGKLEALKIHRGFIDGHRQDRNYSELWYAPAVKNYIKRAGYSFQNDWTSAGEDIRELVKYQIK